MILTKEELEHSIWKKLEVHMQGRLNVCRKINDRPMPESETSLTRGEIKAYKSMLGLNPEFKD